MGAAGVRRIFVSFIFLGELEDYQKTIK